MSRRAQIRLTDEEALDLLAAGRTVVCATNGPDGFPHLMPLWYVVREGEMWAWTYAKSQKVRNLERDARATLQIEAGTRYEELRGVMLRCHVTIHRDPQRVAELGLEIFGRYAPGPGGDPAPDTQEMVLRQAAKRVGLQFVEHSRATWDHRKLAGVY